MTESALEIHQTRRFQKAVRAMDRADKNARDALQRAWQIIADLQADPCHEAAECKRTRHGELRLQNCRKYDLSCGFRLIGLKRERRLIFVYIGSHDDCHAWIEQNRELLGDIISEPIPILGRNCDADNTSEREPLPEVDEYEERLVCRIDQKILREIFAGLCGEEQGDSDCSPRENPSVT